MLGQFLEFSIAAQPLAARSSSIGRSAFSARAGRRPAAHPYLVLFDGAVAIGLHERAQEGRC